MVDTHEGTPIAHSRGNMVGNLHALVERTSQPTPPTAVRAVVISGSPDALSHIGYQNYDELKRFNAEKDLPKPIQAAHNDQGVLPITEQVAPETAVVKSTLELNRIARTRAAIRSLMGR